MSESPVPVSSPVQGEADDTMTPDERLDLIEARADAATPGPWEAHELEAAEYCVLRVSEGDDDYGDDVCSAGSMTDAQFIAAAREDVPWLVEQLRDAREGKPFRLCEQCLSDLEAPMCEDCYRRSGPLAAANSARDAAIDQLGDANREIAALVKQVNDLCDVRDAAIKVKAELRDARTEIERLNLVVAAMDSQADENITEVLALTADRDHWRTEWEDADAKRITAEAELAAERAKAERVEALCDEYRANCDPDTKQAQVAEIFRAALTGGERGE